MWSVKLTKAEKIGGTGMAFHKIPDLGGMDRPGYIVFQAHNVDGQQYHQAIFDEIILPFIEEQREKHFPHLNYKRGEQSGHSRTCARQPRTHARTRGRAHTQTLTRARTHTHGMVQWPCSNSLRFCSARLR